MTDTTQVAKTDAEFLREAADRIRTRMAQAAQDIVEIGRELIAVRERLDDGKFKAWIETEFQMSRSTAYRFISVVENIGARIASHGETRFGRAVLYALASPSTTEEVRTEIIDRAATGEKVTATNVRALKPARPKPAPEIAAAANRAARRRPQPVPDFLGAADRADPAKLIVDAVEQLERINNVSAAVMARISNDQRVELMSQLARANAWLNNTATNIAISGGANRGVLAPASLRLDAVDFMRTAILRIEATLTGRDVQESAS
jgi:Protein of unknown function (DUF3102)